MTARHAVIPIFIPHKGCSFDCIFCNQRKISGQTEDMTAHRIRETIESHLATIRPGTEIEAAFYGGSFTGIDRAKQLEFLEAANEYVESGRIKRLRLSTRPDYIDGKILDYLRKYNVGTIELGVQSLDEDVLKASCRGHTVRDVYDSSRLIKDYGFRLGIQTMTGLPLDTREKDMATAMKVIALEPDIVRIYPVLVIRGTYLESLMHSGEYSPQTLEEAVDICAELLSLYRKNDINVIRIGLQASDSISEHSKEHSEVVGGPFHPAFRQLTESRLALREIEESIARQGLEMHPAIVIRTGPGNISNVIGQKRGNLEYLKKKYGFSKVTIAGDDESGQEIKIE